MSTGEKYDEKYDVIFRVIWAEMGRRESQKRSFPFLRREVAGKVPNPGRDRGVCLEFPLPLQIFVEPRHAAGPGVFGRFGPVAGAVIRIESVGGVFV